MAAEAAGFTAREARGNKVTRVVSPTISVRQRLREIWLSRELLVYLVRTEIKVKYKNSVLGLVWSMISPAMTLAIYFIVFQVVLGNHMPDFVIFLFAGLLVVEPLLSSGVLTGTGVIVNNAGIVKKVSFPREILALAAVGSACVFFFFQSIVMVIFMVVLHAGAGLAVPAAGAVRPRSPGSCWPVPWPCCSRPSTSTCATPSTSWRSSSRRGSGPAPSSTPSSRTSGPSWAAKLTGCTSSTR